MQTRRHGRHGEARGADGRRGRRWLAALMTAACVALGLAAGAWGSASASGGGAPWGVIDRPAGEDRPPAPMREFRGAWVATVANIDWPSSRGLGPARLRAEMGAILDQAAGLGLNAIVLQVRPACDAIYPSELEPWSEFLTGQSGEPPPGAPPGFDPLAEWLAGARERGLELHAWINPFRARHFESRRPDARTHVSVARPELVRSYDNLLWLDPGEPEAREHTLRVVEDLLRRYDLDGVHMDDYFYPYPKDNVPFPDDASFARAGAAATMDRAAWRRSNVDGFVRAFQSRARAARPTARVGISPFGIYRPDAPPGVKGFDAFAGLSADARRWLREGWVDYLSPQLYWPIDSAQPFERLLDWWIANNDQRRHIWPGLFTSRVLPRDPEELSRARDAKGRASWEPGEIQRQIAATRARDGGGSAGALTGGATGHIHFSFVALQQNRRGLADALKQGAYAEPALTPAFPWLAPESDGPGPVRLTAGDTSAAWAADAARNPGGSGRAWAPVQRWVVWTRRDRAEPGRSRWTWRTVPSGTMSVSIDAGVDAVAVAGLDRVGRLGPATVAVRGGTGGAAGASGSAGAGRQP